MTDLSPKTVLSIVEQYNAEIEDLAIPTNGVAKANPHLYQLTLRRISSDLPLLLNGLNRHKHSKSYSDAHRELLGLSNKVDQLLYQTSKLVENFSKNFAAESAPTSVPMSPKIDPVVSDVDDYASLRQRLLAQGTSTSLDKEASLEKMNEYHETLQEELMSDLSGVVTALKDSAILLSSKIIDDSKILASTNENLLKSLSLMQTVGTSLNGYLNEKTGGKIGLLFIIKTMAFVFILTFVMIVLIKILPKM